MSGRFLPADHSAGDANTIGGYAAVHGRPAAFEGPDGMSYSVEIVVDRLDDPPAFAAYLLFLRWRRVGPQGIEGHLETDYLVQGADAESVRRDIGARSLASVRGLLLDLIGDHPRTSERKWWDVMKSDDPGEDAT